MRRIFLFLFLCLFITSEAQDAESIKLSLPALQSIAEIELSDARVQFHISTTAINLEEIEIEGSKYIKISIPHYYNTGVPGDPSLPAFSKLIEKNNTANYALQLIYSDSVIIDLDDYFPGSFVWPAQFSVQKGQVIAQKKFLMNDSLYNSEGWTNLPLFSFENEGRMRGLDIGHFRINPIQYQPSENKIKVYYNIQGALVPDISGGDTGIRGSSRAFDRIMNSIVQEDKKNALKKLIKDEPMTLVILSDTIFRNSLQPLIKWKNQKGFKVIEAYTNDPQVGSDKESIKNYLSNLYSLPPTGYASPSYLLIVGEGEHVPRSQSNTDLYYTTFDGPDDYLPELMHGRISVKNELELNNVLNKILEYERYLMPDPEYLNESILIAGNDGSYASTYGNGQINYASDYYFNEAHGINANVFLHPEASNLDLEIRNAIAEGVALVNYTGHGDGNGWIDPAFQTQHINSLSNRSKYPLLIGNGCRTLSGDSFGNAIVKAENKGAIAYIGCSNDSYWLEDFYWSVGIGPQTAHPVYESTTRGFYDKVFHDRAEPDSIWAPSLGEMIFAGNMTVQHSSSPHKEYYWMIYQLMGDPTLVPWFTVPENPPVVFPASLPPDASSVDIEVEPYNYVAISVRDTLINAKHADELGLASLSIPEEYRGDTILLVVTGDRRQPFIRQIPDVGHFDLLEIGIVNESILGDSILSNGEQASFNITVKNSSTSPSEVCDLIFRSSGNAIEILDSLTTLPLVNPGDTIELENVFTFKVLEDATDQTEDYLTFVRVADITSNYLNHSIRVHTPELSIISFTIQDESLGNGNGMLETGETVTMSFEINNSGSYTSDSLRIKFAESDALFSDKHILTGSPITPGESINYTVDIVIPDMGEQPDFLLVPIYIGDGNYTLDSVVMVIGKYFEDFSADSVSLLPWMEMDWQRDTSEYYLGPASLRSAEIENRQSSSIKIKVHVFEDDSVSFNFKVSSEAGYDHLRFYIDEEEVHRWSGEYGWANYSHQLASGLHLLEWMYKKDINTAVGLDAAWIDDVVFPKHSFIPDLYIDSIYIKRSGSFLSDETLKIDIVNLGFDTIRDFSVRYRNNNEAWNEINIEDTLLSGNKKLIAIPGTIDLSEVREHQLQVVIRADEDIWPWNDSLFAHIDHYEYPDLSISYIDHDTLNRDYVNLNALVENKGNIPADGFFYDVVIDEEFSFSGKSTISLEPGESAETSLNLINVYYDWLETGYHDYRVELAEDSAMDNNSVAGSIYWIATTFELESVSGIRFYPNPASEVLYFEATDDLLFPCKLRITDVLGRELLARDLHSSKEQILLGGSLQSDGIYNIVIQNSHGDLAFKGRFILMR